MALGEGRARWIERWTEASDLERAPSKWICEQARAHLAPGTVIVEVAGGNGRHARALAAAGFRAVLCDFAEVAVRQGRDADRRVAPLVADVWALPFAPGTVPALCVVNFLERALFPSFAELLQPGGTLFYETYTTANAKLVREHGARSPRSDQYMLLPGELERLASPLQVLAHREGIADDAAGLRHVASIVAMKR